jgi:YD repeat-containing protein
VRLVEPARATAKNGAVDPFAAGFVYASPTTTYALNAFGQVVSETESAGVDSAGNQQAGVTRVTRSRFDAAGYEVQSIDASGSAQSYKVDAAGRRVEESRQINVTLSGWTVGGAALTRTQTIRRGYTYDVMGQQLSTTDWYTAADNTQKTTINSAVYNRFGEVTSQLLNGYLQAGYVYDQAGRVTQQQNAQGITRVDYDLNAKASRSNQIGDANTAADDRITYTRYDVLGRALEQHLPAFEANINADTLNNINLTLATPIIRQSYDRWGNLLTRTDARGYITTYTYDHNNKQLTETLPVTDILRENGTSYRASLIHEKRYDLNGLLIQEVDLVGPYAGVPTSTVLRTRQHQYNQVGELLRDIDALGYARTYLMDVHGNRVATRDALGVVLVDGYDAMSRQVSHGIVRNGSAVTLLTNQYDQAGRLVGEISGSTAVEETLASASGSGVTTGVAGNVRYTLFDERGNAVRTRNESKVEKSYEYNEANRKAKETDGLNNTLTSTYDEANYGRLSGHKDLLGRVFTYTYNGFGQVLSESATDYFTVSGGLPIRPAPMQKTTYSYYSNGLVGGTQYIYYHASEYEPDSKWASYNYDLSGNKVRETISNTVSSLLGLVSVTGSVETRYSFDEGSRLAGASIPSGGYAARLDSLKYSYDELGSRRRSYLDTTNQSGVRTVIDNWYKYDQEGRALIDSGYMSSGQVVAGKIEGKAKGVVTTYDAAGRRQTTEQWDKTSGSAEIYFITEYDYNDFGQVVSSSERQSSRTLGANTSQATQPLSGAALKFSNVYDPRGYQSLQINYTAGVISGSSNYGYRGDGKLITQKTYTVSGGVQRLAQDNYFGEAAMLDSAGNQRSYRYVIYNSDGVSIKFSNYYNKDYSLFDTYKEGSNTVSSTQSSSPGVTTFWYNGKGDLLMVTGSTTVHAFATNADGQLIARKDSNNSTVQNYLYYQGGALANVGNVSAPEISDTLTPISTDYPARTPSSYVVNQGDTLGRVAQSVWGDAAMWYLIADANGLSADQPLTPGGALIIPNVVGSTHNDATTFKPYNADDVIGDTTPSPQPPPPPKPKKKKSSGLASVVMVVVAVVATVFTAGAAAPLLGVASAGGVMATGAAVLTGAAGITMGSIGAAFIGGAVGSAASQLVGKSMGVVNSFSWSRVAASGVGAGIGAGVGSIVAGGKTAQQLAEVGSYGKIAAGSVLNSLGNYAANRVIGLEASFSWTGMASAALSSVASAGVSNGLGLSTDNFKSNFFNGAVGAQVNSGVQTLFGKGGKLDYGSVAADAFGNAIGNGVVEASLGGDFFGPASGDLSQKQKIVARAFAATAFRNKVVDMEQAVVESKDLEKRAAQVVKDLADPSIKRSDGEVEELRKAYIADLASDASYLPNTSTDPVENFRIQSMKSVLGMFGVSRLGNEEITKLGISVGLFENKDSDFYAALFKDNTTGEYYLANRGTESAIDAKTDTVGAAGYVDQQFIDAQDLGFEVALALGDKVTFTGHSLGGELASIQAISTRKRAITFNAAGVHPRVGRELTLRVSDATANIKAYHVSGDLVSIAQDSVGYDIAAAVLGTAIVNGIEVGRAFFGNTSSSNFGFSYAPGALGRRIELPSLKNGEPMSRMALLNPLNQLEQHKNGAVLRSLEYVIGGGEWRR